MASSPTDPERDACIAAAAKLRTRPRLGQSGLPTDHQYRVREDLAHHPANVKTQNTKSASQVSLP